MEKIKSLLKTNTLALHIWAFTAAFGAYFCTYAFRKPFSTGQFEGIFISNFDAKTVFVISQVLGYMFSKFIGIKIISELTSGARIRLIFAFIFFAEFCLLLFGILPLKYKPFALFLNGLPLGMVYGIIFSFLEGRRFTEFLGLGLSINMIMTSGVLKTIYLWIQRFTGMTEFGLPAFLGLLFLPLLLLFLWMLSLIPLPSQTDQTLKKKREAMSKNDKQVALKTYGFGVILVVLFYSFLTTIRDFRDNFNIEIWKSIDPNFEISIFARTELWISFWVFLCIFTLNYFKNNLKALLTINILFGVTMLLISISNKLITSQLISYSLWMILQGISFYLPYLIIQVAFFDRLIPILNIKGNAGFFIYLCDSAGYLGSTLLLILKEIWAPRIDPKLLLIQLSNGLSFVGIILIIFQFLYFEFKRKNIKKFSNINIEITQ